MRHFQQSILSTDKVKFSVLERVFFCLFNVNKIQAMVKLWSIYENTLPKQVVHGRNGTTRRVLSKTAHIHIRERERLGLFNFTKNKTITYTKAI